MVDPLDGSIRRIRRAIETQKRLEDEIRAFGDSVPYEVSVEADGRGPQNLALVLTSKPTNPDWGVLIGECLHNLRAALDNAVWEMIQRNGSVPVDGVSGFPTKRKKGEWNEGGRRATKMIDGIDAPSRELIKWSQPFHVQDRGADPTRQTLWALNELWNIDKHRVIHTTAVATDIGRFEVLGHEEGVDVREIQINKGWALDPQVVAGRVLLSAPSNGHLLLGFNGTSRVAFAEPATERLNVCGMSVTQVLAAIGNDVLSLVRGFQAIVAAG